MFDWLVEGWLGVYLVLLTAAIVLLAVWWRTRKRYWLIVLGVVAILAGLYALLDRLVETNYEQMVRKTCEMAASAKDKDPNHLFEHISDDFDYHGLRKPGLLAVATSRIRNGDVREVVVWDFEPRSISTKDRTGNIVFHIKVKTTWSRDELFFRCEAAFTLDQDGQWRLRTFELFDPTRNNERIQIDLGG